MGVSRLARQIGASDATAQELLTHHRDAFPIFWRWSDGIVVLCFAL
jgi:hypothetical protein